ncbi:ATP-dependent DNA helicase RecG [soil metagenome]
MGIAAAPTNSNAAERLALDAPLTAVRGVGIKRAEAFAALGVRNVAQLITYLPTRHERLEAEAPISELAADTIVSARGLIAATRIVNKPPRPRFEAVLIDDTGRLDLTWFNGLYLKDKLVPGMRVRVLGKAKRFGPPPGLQVVNPSHWVLGDAEAEEPALREAELRPVYPASEALGSRIIAQTVAAALEPALKNIRDHLPSAFRAERELMELTEAYRGIHRPRDEEHAKSARRRLAYDELFLLQVAIQLNRAAKLGGASAPALKNSAKIDAAIRARLPFSFTAAQDRVAARIAADLALTRPANRLIQGDVGSGKTAVALYGMLLAVAGKRQGALMAPTELLAEQHFASLGRMLSTSRVRMALLTGSVTGAARKQTLAELANGEIDIVVGTHALLSEGVRFHALGVAVVDEQHRFGVHQRAALRVQGGAGAARKAEAPHTLVMTATPIPRTLALTIFGDLDVSTIDELPPGRKPVATRVVTPASRSEVYGFVRKRLERGEQAFIVVPAIEPGAELVEPAEGMPAIRLRSVAEVAKELSAGALKGLRLGQVHGRLARAERERVMDEFRAGTLDALIATTVIEVGVDVPNATVMVVEDAERFGLAQLHQLRGRVGRGTKPSVCILIGAAVTDAAGARLESLAKLSDGFKLAERDFELRGFGDVIGSRQSGLPPFKVADLARDVDLLHLSRRDAQGWIARSPLLAAPEEALLKRRVLKAHGKWLGLGDVA